ncbi:glyoxalase/bleomycin resistance protein/dioxygenase superfamily protein [Umezawaea tangerina]|uniref:Glyoxalase/bleomycin resistance protein/dioxygenase superfamily protein n=1 Tax=Umezawaea tangerina TaxID=84725 RepID=A0A2T0S5J2_9PSEU|nr:VOC family protein [Umezawaea tangerina]PRY28676.1 glyoxalase/bleomycin resistance protein/dioxygenase superfamily protein [Umezawaea tangerina]
MNHGLLHHVELWVPHLTRAEDTLGWLLRQLGWSEHQRWDAGISWRLGPTYIVVEQSPALTGTTHHRTSPGLNHLALHVNPRSTLDTLTEAAQRNGWTLLFPDRHPHAGGPDHYAAYLENHDGFEIELVATSDDTSAD